MPLPDCPSRKFLGTAAVGPEERGEPKAVGWKFNGALLRCGLPAWSWAGHSL